MTQSDPTSRRPGLWTSLAATAIAGASAVTIALPPTIAAADPTPPPPSTTVSPAPAAPAPAPADPNAAAAPASPAPAPAPAAPPAPADPNAPAAAVPAPAATPAPPADPNAPAPAPAPAPADPNAPAPAPAPADPNAPAPAPAPADPNAPAPAGPGPAAPAAPAAEAGRIDNGAGGFSYVLPAGWEVADASRLSYGQALLLKPTGPAPLPGQQGATANDTSILLGRLDMKLFAGAEADNGKAAVRLASDMGEFFMPFAGTRINQATTPLQAGDLSGFAASYDVKFTDTAKPNGQIWAGVVGDGTAKANQPPGRWFVVWLGTSKDPIDVAAAKNLAQSIRPYTPPAAPAAPAADPNAPAAPSGSAPGAAAVGVPVPVTTPVPGMTPGT